MPLSDFETARTVIEYKGKPLTKVRGLSLEDVTVLTRLHMPDLVRIYEVVQAKGDIFNEMNKDDFVLRLLTELPMLAAVVIARAADEIGTENLVRAMPLALQVLIIREIIKLTFEDFGGPKAFGAFLKGQVQPGGQLPPP